MEKKNLNHAIWVWNPEWTPYNLQIDAFDYRHGPDPNNKVNLDDNPLIKVLQKY